jgi:MinD-like ATPase involved in chromosome partitioning or flagellar assembly
MKTIVFYSYKGGVGRSLLLANSAMLLASLGKKVVALDLDFEAPGLHYKLPRNAAEISGRQVLGGAVPYLLAALKGPSESLLLAENMYSVPNVTETGGWLRVMPAGPSPARSYWVDLRSLVQELSGEHGEEKGLFAALDLQARIQELLTPDYLLVDARTGVTQLGSIATTILADDVVCLFVPNHESLDGTLAIATALKSVTRLAEQEPLRIVPVMSRVVVERAPSSDHFSETLKDLLDLCHIPAQSTAQMPFILPHDSLPNLAEQAGRQVLFSTDLPYIRAVINLLRHIAPSDSPELARALDAFESPKARRTWWLLPA